MYIGIELPTEEKAFKLKKERAIKINDSMNYIAERSWLLLKYSEPAISKESFENEVFIIISFPRNQQRRYFLLYTFVSLIF